MFPHRADMTVAQQSEIEQWYSEALKDDLRLQTDRLPQIYATDGTSLGFCGGAMENCRHIAKSPVNTPRVSISFQIPWISLHGSLY